VFKKLKTKATALRLSVLTFMFLTMMSVVAYADVTPMSTTFNTGSVISEGLGELSSQIFSVITIVVPVAFGITAAIIGIRFGIRFVRSLIGR
jgi:hypothetical protein